MKRFVVGLLVAGMAATVDAATVRTGAAGASPEEFVLVQPVYEPDEQDAWGLSSQTVMTVRVEDFMPPANTFTWTTVNTGGIYMFQSTAASGDWWANADLPTGVIVERIELQACDTTATGNIVFGLARMDAPGQTGSNVTPVGTTGAAATPGCAFFSVVPNGGSFVVDNRNNSYLLFVDWIGNFTAANKVAAFRIFYRRQVSPAPATASFNDVPVGHPQHRFVEALAAAGITGGCGPSLFCPDSPLTRGQMAVFLSAALGLHFPN